MMIYLLEIMMLHSYVSHNLRVSAVVRLHLLNESPPAVCRACRFVRLPLRTVDEGRGAGAR